MLSRGLSSCQLCLRVSEKGAYAPSLIYSPGDLADVMEYGNILGIETAIEIDMPGHTSSIWFSHPELITSFNTQPYSTNCAEPPCGSLKLNSTEVYDFLGKMFNDLLPRIGQHSQFRQLRSRRIRAAGLIPIVWEEMVLEWNITMEKDILVNSWLSDESVAQIANRGHKVIVGNYNQWQTFTLTTTIAHHARIGALVYSYDPLSGVPENSTSLVVGGEVHLWAEQIDGTNFDRQAWPRAAGCSRGVMEWSQGSCHGPEQKSNRRCATLERV
ncbi:hypothetical protein MRB53_040680 [Persea americana]|nr:hypothetical protein MRB53_040680 [Persea americana]